MQISGRPFIFKFLPVLSLAGCSVHGSQAADQAPTPKLIANPIATPDGLTASQVSVFQAAANTNYRWRTVRSLARQVRLTQGSVQGDLERLVEPDRRGGRVPGAGRLEMSSPAWATKARFDY